VLESSCIGYMKLFFGGYFLVENRFPHSAMSTRGVRRHSRGGLNFNLCVVFCQSLHEIQDLYDTYLKSAINSLPY
jgi:hypothetical protein